MTRTWEIGDNAAMPTDLVREQDFILRVRRMQRLSTPHLVVNLALSAIAALRKSQQALENVEAKLKEFAKVTNGTYADMSNGDVFIIWEETSDAKLLAERLVGVLPIEPHESKHTDHILLTYHIPRDYTALRTRANHYVELVRTAQTMPSDPNAALLHGEAAHGTLTAKSVDQIGKVLGDIDVRAYGRTQPIYRANEDGTLQPVSEEYFISFDDLRRERFPKLDLVTPEHLFFALCEMVDERLLAMFAEAPAAVIGRSLHLNLSVGTVIGNIFARFAHSVPRDKRNLMTFEFHRGDLFQDFARTLNAIELLHKEGFKIAIDSVTPDMLPYLNLDAFGADYIKINVSGDRIALLGEASVRNALMRLPADRLIFFRCDSNKALMAGRELGIKLFQGWHIDDLVQHAHGKGA